MLPQSRYQQARNEAMFHVQVEVLHVEAGLPTPAQVRVDAEVVRVFRGEHALKVCDKLHFFVSVLTGEEELDRVPIGGTLWTNYAALQLARYLEVFLDGTPPACEIRLWQLTILDAPTDQPAMAVPPPAMIRSRSWFRRAGRFMIRLFRGKEFTGQSK